MENTLSNLKEFAKYLFDLGKNAGELHPQLVDGGDNANQLVIVPEGTKLVNVTREVPELPEFKHERRKLIDVPSFIGYFNEHKDENSRIFAQITQKPFTFEGIIDYHGTAGKPANWCRHCVTLTLNYTDRFLLWLNKSNESFSQEEFTEFLKDNRFDIVEPNNAQLLELAMHLEATRECRAEGSVRTNRGVTLSYEEVTSAHRGGVAVEVPDTLKIRLPMFQGGDEIEIPADFKFRIRDGRIVFAYRLLNVDNLIRNAVTAIRDRIEQETETPVYL